VTVMETLSHQFIQTLLGPRDRLYGLALAKAGTPAAAESLMAQAVRAAFCDVAKGAATDIVGAVEKELAGNAPANGGGERAGTEAAVAMPADVWARLAAAVQVEAAASNHEAALHPDSVLLRPDPMLAPKKGRGRPERSDFDLTTPRRFWTVVGLAVLLGAIMTIYLLTRPPAPATRTGAASQGATSQRVGNEGVSTQRGVP
jgi:hypothetical protein